MNTRLMVVRSGNHLVLADHMGPLPGQRQTRLDSAADGLTLFHVGFHVCGHFIRMADVGEVEFGHTRLPEAAMAYGGLSEANKARFRAMHGLQLLPPDYFAEVE